MKMQDLYDSQAKAYEAGEDVIRRANEDKWSDELRAELKRSHDEVGKLQETIEARQKSDELSARNAEQKAKNASNATTPREKYEADAQVDGVDRPYMTLFRKWARGGFGEFTREDRAQYAEHLAKEKRAQSIGTDSEGGFAVDDQWMRQIFEAEKMYAGILDVVTVINTEGGNPLHFPTSDGTAEEATIVAEGIASTEDAFVLGEIVLGAFKLSSGLVIINNELLQDSFVDIEGFTAKRIGERVGRAEAALLETGAGTTEPFGIHTRSTLGATAALATVIDYNDLSALVHAVDPAYAAPGRGRWGFNWATAGQIRTLSDTGGFPIFTPPSAGMPGMLLGYPFSILQTLPAATLGLTPVIFGAFDTYYARIAGGLRLSRSVDLLFAEDQTVFKALKRIDGDLVDGRAAASGESIQHLAMAAA